MPYVHHTLYNLELVDYLYELVEKYYKGRIVKTEPDQYNAKLKMCEKNFDMVKSVGELGTDNKQKIVYLLIDDGYRDYRTEFKKIVNELGGKFYSYLNGYSLGKIDIVVIAVHHGLCFDGSRHSDYSYIKKEYKSRKDMQFIYLDDFLKENGLPPAKFNTGIRIFGNAKGEYMWLSHREEKVVVAVECPLTDSWIDREFETEEEERRAREEFDLYGGDYYVDAAEVIMYIIGGMHEVNKYSENIPETSELTQEEKDKLYRLIEETKNQRSGQSIF